jgi:hypothetical protein
MKGNKTGIIVGFVFGMAGFLLLFKIVLLDNIPPADEIAPGIVVFASLLNGLLFASIGYSIQRSLERRGTSHKKVP